MSQHSARPLIASSPRPLVTLATIHGYKGEEADHVVVATELTERTQWNYLSARDTENRVFYVAATRARQTLLWARTKRTWHYEP